MNNIPSKTIFRVGLILAALHLLFSVFAIATIAATGHDAQWQFGWLVFLPIDFPISLITLFGGYFCPDVHVGFLPYPVSSLRHFVLPSFIHGILGPIWYFFIPAVAVSLFQKLFRRK